jgi:hypothetical protein
MFIPATGLVARGNDIAGGRMGIDIHEVAAWVRAQRVALATDSLRTGVRFLAGPALLLVLALLPGARQTG